MSIIRTQPRVVMTKAVILSCKNVVSVTGLINKLYGASVATSSSSEVFEPLAAVRVRAKTLAPIGNSVEAFKTHTLAQIAAAPFLIDAAAVATVEKRLAEFQRARTIQEARVVPLVATIEASHQTLFAETLTAACGEAARQIGFSQITFSKSNDGTRRIIATDAKGRSLVSEVSHGQQPTLTTEVVNAPDGACANIMQDFEAALEAGGVRGAARRRSTNGAVQLKVALDLVLRQPVKESLAAQQHRLRAAQRTARLNQRRQRERH